MQELNRCHLGLRLPDSLAESLKSVQLEVRRKGGGDHLRYPSLHEMGIVLVSLGELRAMTMGQVIESVKPIAAKCPHFSVALEGTCGEPNNSMPKSVLVGIHDDTGLLAMFADALTKAVALVVSLPNLNPFSPTVEIARLKTLNDRIRADVGRAVKMTQESKVGEVRIDHLDLLVNESGPSGPYLKTVETLPLVGA